MIRIDFVVREVYEDDPDSNSDDESLRFIRFGKQVEPHMVKDFFESTGIAVGIMFPPRGDYVLCLKQHGNNKIALIKEIRVLTGCGLKEAKDAVERPLSSAICHFPEHRRNDIAKRMETIGYGSELTDIRHKSLADFSSIQCIVPPTDLIRV
jgi:hypothetical protein